MAVDNLQGIKVLGHIIRVDHIHQYKLPKDIEKLDHDKRELFESEEEEEDQLLEYSKPKKENNRQ